MSFPCPERGHASAGRRLAAPGTPAVPHGLSRISSQAPRPPRLDPVPLDTVRTDHDCGAATARPARRPHADRDDPGTGTAAALGPAHRATVRPVHDRARALRYRPTPHQDREHCSRPLITRCERRKIFFHKRSFLFRCAASASTTYKQDLSLLAPQPHQQQPAPK